MIFLDASVLLAAEDSDDAHHSAAVALLTVGALATLDLAVYETTNVATIRCCDPAAAERLLERIWAIAEFGALVRVDQALAQRTAEFAAAHTLSAYDAAYVAAAERLGAQLASCDERDLLISKGLAHPPAALMQA